AFRPHAPTPGVQAVRRPRDLRGLPRWATTAADPQILRAWFARCQRAGGARNRIPPLASLLRAIRGPDHLSKPFSARQARGVGLAARATRVHSQLLRRVAVEAKFPGRAVFSLLRAPRAGEGTAYPGARQCTEQMSHAHRRMGPAAG